ncbi:hypothetical protein FHR99_001667 [Litorivivens lipolytica]|uniref:Uncharacterized protein n=1 Tax=Litorivivens lipolytica TaxID=1524264 RepID=A0A7W4Z709_9GAMM|nr:hypothetical protein [Litorivivens lipolytica]MBB3047431.1 hypothetical protein [Litorivivens lipolytica]
MAADTIHYTPREIEIGTVVSIDGKKWVCSNQSTGIEHKIRLREVDGSGTGEISREHFQELWEDERASVIRNVRAALLNCIQN